MGRLAVFRYLNTNSGDHFYTTNKGELGEGGGEWILEGNPAFYIEAPESKSNLERPVPLIRWLLPSSRERFWFGRIIHPKGNPGYHLYTVDVNERPEGWNLENAEMGYCESAEPTGFREMIPLYRYRSEKNSGRFYTTNYNELGAGNSDWFLEGNPMCYVYGNAEPPRNPSGEGGQIR